MTPGAPSRCWAAQDIAENATPAEDELAGPLTCPVDRAAQLWSEAELALGRAGDALVSADRAVARFEATPEEHRNRGSERMTRLKQVKAHLVLGDLRAAEDALQPVLETPATHRVRPLVHSVTEIGALAGHTGPATSAIATRLRDAAARFGEDTVTKELTA